MSAAAARRAAAAAVFAVAGLAGLGGCAEAETDAAASSAGGAPAGASDTGAAGGDSDRGSLSDAGPLRPPTDAAVPPDAVGPEADGRSRPEDASLADARATDAAPCATGTFECPLRVDALPFSDRRDTREAPSDAADAYACSPADESGGEWIYRVEVAERGVLTASLDDVPGDAIDVDVHLLDAPRADACLSRDNVALSRFVEPGTYYVVADTWVDGDGAPHPGPFTLTLSLQPAGDDRCALQTLDVEMVWGSCAPGIDCYEADDAGGTPRRFLRTPTTGPVVREAHLVTVADDFGGGWPSGFRDGIDAHYALSEAATGYSMDRAEPWAPSGEGGSEYGQSAYGRPLPVEDEAWYVNMYWRHRPPPGTRMLIRNPVDGRAVVAAAGYETGPGDHASIGGVTEEIHHHLGTGHGDTLLLGFLVDGTLPLGPIDCGP